MADLMRKAQKTLESSGGLMSFFGGGKAEKYEEAAELFGKAAAAYKMQEQLSQAGQAYEKAAEVYQNQLNDAASSANSYLDAYKAYRIVPDIPNAARCLEKTIQYQTSNGKFFQAAGNQHKLGELLVEGAKLEDPANRDICRKAVQALITAGNWFRGENSESLASKAFLKAADIAAFSGDYDTAVEQYEKVAKSFLGTANKYSVPVAFQKAILCLLAKGDHIAMNKAIGEFMSLDPSFEQSREFQLMLKLMTVMEAGDLRQFEEFTALNFTDEFKSRMIEPLKAMLEQEDDLA